MALIINKMAKQSTSSGATLKKLENRRLLRFHLSPVGRRAPAIRRQTGNCGEKRLRGPARPAQGEKGGESRAFGASCVGNGRIATLPSRQLPAAPGGGSHCFFSFGWNQEPLPATGPLLFSPRELGRGTGTPRSLAPDPLLTGGLRRG